MQRVVAVLEARLGRRIVEQAGDTHAGALPIRDHRTGAVVAQIPACDADGWHPIVCNGLVVNYYREVGDEWEYPLFHDGRPVFRSRCPRGQKWLAEFDPGDLSGPSCSWDETWYALSAPAHEGKA